MKITLATYNILHGYHAEQILDNIKFLIDQGADIICIQEAEIPIKKILPVGWQIEYYKVDIGCMLATAWNASKVHFTDKKTILFPSLLKPSFAQKFTKYKKFTIIRGTLAIYFNVGGQTLRIINTHLAWEGGMKHRMLQLGSIINTLNEKSVNFDIIAGDFNTAAPALFQGIEEKKIENKLGKDWINVFPNLAYTCDSSFSAPQDGLEKYVKILRIFGIKFRQRLDYIFTKNLKIVSKEMHELPGSDHRPLVVTLEF